MRFSRALIALTSLVLLAGCGGRLTAEEARDLLNEASIATPIQSPVFIPDGVVRDEVLKDKYFQRARVFGWVNCEPAGRGMVRCTLTPMAKELAPTWKRGGGRYGEGWYVGVFSFAVTRVDVKRQDGDRAEAMFGGKWDVNETGRKFGVFPRAEGLTWIAVFEKKDDAWQVAEVIDTVPLIRIR